MSMHGGRDSPYTEAQGGRKSGLVKDLFRFAAKLSRCCGGEHRTGAESGRRNADFEYKGRQSDNVPSGQFCCLAGAVSDRSLLGMRGLIDRALFQELWQSGVT